MPGVHAPELSAATLAVAAAASWMGGLLMLVPSLLLARRIAPGAAMRTDGAGAVATRLHWASWLVFAQVAMSAAGVFGAGRLVVERILLERIDLGFRSEGVVVASLTLPRAAQPLDRVVALQRDGLARLQLACTTWSRWPPSITCCSAIRLPSPRSRWRRPPTGPTKTVRVPSCGPWAAPISTRCRSSGPRAASSPARTARPPHSLPSSTSASPSSISMAPGGSPRQAWLVWLGRAVDDHRRRGAVQSRRRAWTGARRRGVRPLRTGPAGAEPQLRHQVVGIVPTLARDIQATLKSLDASLPPAHIVGLDDVVAAHLGHPEQHARIGVMVAGVAILLTAFGLSATTVLAMAIRRRDLAMRLCLGATWRSLQADVLSGIATRSLDGRRRRRRDVHAGRDRSLPAGAVDARSTDPLIWVVSVLAVMLVMAAAGLGALRAYQAQPADLLRPRVPIGTDRAVRAPRPHSANHHGECSTRRPRR